ncbi:Uncharacterised protein [Salmonella enterica subsp. enterica]|nr:Uncharacterised protein [Salmonella enterica subsp. enterica] [Salmonella enterica subsp. enterica serovar Florida]
MNSRFYFMMMIYYLTYINQILSKLQNKHFLYITKRLSSYAFYAF